MATAYRIKDWDNDFETHESRKRKSGLDWVALKTKQGKKYRRLAKHPEGAVAWACFTQLLLIGAKMPVRGLLADEDGPLTVDDMADLSCFPAELFETGIKVLMEQHIAWLEEVNLPESAALSRASAAPARATPATETEPNLTEQDLTEQDGTGREKDFSRSSDSDSVSASPPNRDRAYVEYSHVVGRLFATDPDQAKADSTVARNWWDDIIWPRGLPPNEAMERYERFKKLARTAANQGRKPMAYIAKLIHRDVKT